MKVLQVNVVYEYGSTGKIVADIHKVLIEEGIQSIVCYGAGPCVSDSNIYKIVKGHEPGINSRWAKYTGLQYASGFLSTFRLIKIIKNEKPDIVHLHCINGFFVHIYYLLRFLKRKRIKTVITLHAEFMYTGSCGHAFDCEKWKTGCGDCPQLWDATYSKYFDRTATAWKKMKKAFKNFDELTVTCVSPWVYSRAKQAPILKGKKMVTIENGLDSKEIFYPRPFQDLKESLGIKNEKIILHVTANFSAREDDLKGGRFLYKLADNLINDNVKIIIIDGKGNTGIDLLANMIDVGRVKDQKVLAQFYSMADLTVVTSKKETFNMPVAESLACGTPVVGFKAGGPETISIKEYSEFVDYGDVEALTLCARKWLEYKTQKGPDISKTAREYYSKEKMCMRYLEVYKSMLE